MLDDHTTAPIDARLRAALGFLKKLTLEPDAIGKADVAPLAAQGISKDAIEDVIYVCYLFSTYTRLADAMGWDIPVPAAFEVSARRLLSRGYA